jgi:aminoglycoside phosphotransferase (APT) family kinase protein
VNEDALAEWLAAKLRVPVVGIVDLRRHTEGFSWETYTVEADLDGERRGFVLRAEPNDGLLAPYDIEHQFRLHCAIHGSPDVPMPEPYWLERDRRLLGMPFYAMERLLGRVPVPWRGDDPEVFPTPAVRAAVGREFVRVQAAIHAVDWRRHGLQFLGDDSGAEAATLAQIERWSSFYERSVLVEVPLLRRATAWLRANPACSGRLALCHGDYRIGNFMLRGGRIVGVFDWELAHVSDPIEDVAYSGLPLWRGRHNLLSQLLPADQYFRYYQEHTGLPVDRAVYRFWTVLGLTKAASVHLAAARAFEEGRTNDLRLAALGHQVHYVLRFLARELER